MTYRFNGFTEKANNAMNLAISSAEELGHVFCDELVAQELGRGAGARLYRQRARDAGPAERGQRCGLYCAE